MKRIILSLLILLSINSYADDVSDETLQTIVSTEIAERENKINVCVEDYKKKQSRSYAKNVQKDLYDLMYNFNKIVSRVYGKKKSTEDDITDEQRVDALAKIQCEAYYKIEESREF